MTTLTPEDINIRIHREFNIKNDYESVSCFLYFVSVPKLNINCEMDGRGIYLLFVRNNLEVPKQFQVYSNPDY